MPKAGETILTPELQEKICGYIREGMGIREAARKCGIAKRTYFNWLERATADDAAGNETVFTEFADAAEAAGADLEAACLEVIQEANSWQSKAWILERKWPQRWGTRNRQEVTGADGEPVQIVIKFEGRPNDAPDNAEAA